MSIDYNKWHNKTDNNSMNTNPSTMKNNFIQS